MVSAFAKTLLHLPNLRQGLLGILRHKAVRNLANPSFQEIHKPASGRSPRQERASPRSGGRAPAVYSPVCHGEATPWGGRVFSGELRSCGPAQSLRERGLENAGGVPSAAAETEQGHVQRSLPPKKALPPRSRQSPDGMPHAVSVLSRARMSDYTLRLREHARKPV